MKERFEVFGFFLFNQPSLIVVEAIITFFLIHMPVRLVSVAVSGITGISVTLWLSCFTNLYYWSLEVNIGVWVLT
jgi:hypothetical protein